jgi:hypothetical protein
VLNGWDIKPAKELWRAWWGEAASVQAFTELQRRNLVSVVAEHGFYRLQVQDVVRSLGQGILRDPQYRTPDGARVYGSRLWETGGSTFLRWTKASPPHCMRDEGPLGGDHVRAKHPLASCMPSRLPPQKQCVPPVAIIIEDTFGQARLPLRDMDFSELRLLRAHGGQVCCAQCSARALQTALQCARVHAVDPP